MTDDASAGTPPKGACLHCNAENNKIQVHCDSCGGFICSECHWCHEANHEIRVCDRCDSFFCKDCDEMDQCDDCGEVVCSGCCSLLSCKFCGGGLCEECAVACGRCGIVLCARDAKFAVECDTCKLSYCLVCLASGQKEACLRCGHRPSKRMEQLVHLRLKSIYKAFQQSARTSDKHIHLKRAALAAQKKALGPKIDPAIQQAQADAAAASLLKELEEEEAQAKKQTSKKKKKRKKKRVGEDGDEEDRNEAMKDINLDDTGPDDKWEGAVDKCQQPPQNAEVPGNQYSTAYAMTSDDQPHKNPSIDKLAKRSSHHSNGIGAQHVDEVRNSGEECVIPVNRVAATPLYEYKHSLMEEMEEKLISLVTSRDSAGIEDLLEKWKGVPGRSVLRKNAKKALKKLKEDEAENIKEPLLALVSSAPKLKTFEVVLEMSPMVVGWVIGKGGVKIRDIMEESGAKVWIDQESMQIHQPRIVYVSGPKDSVDLAVTMIQSAVNDAPKEGGDFLKDEEVVADPQFAFRKNGSREVCEKGDWAEHKMTCEAGFVPLLIGKRGWTIKHIQDSSGAKVDIDQNVTPRVVTITGRSESVQTAIRLVRDVLSYPEGQLQRKESEDNIVDFDLSGPAHSPPPSSLIMMSTISASSSLSSTPEPSMASSKQGRCVNDFNHLQQQYFPQPPGIFDGRVECYSSDVISGLAQRQQSNFQLAAFSRQENLLQHELVTPQNGFHHPQLGAPGVSRMVPPGLGCSVATDAYNVHLTTPQSMPPPPQRPPLTQPVVQNQFQQQGSIYQQRQASAPDSALMDCVDQLGHEYQPNQSPQRHSSGLWDAQNNSVPPYVLHQQQPPVNSVRSIHSSHVGASLSSIQDDSNLVDSLFGPSDSNLLDDLQGLNISGWGGTGNTGNWKVEKAGNSRLVLEDQFPSESRFNWG